MIRKNNRLNVSYWVLRRDFKK